MFLSTVLEERMNEFLNLGWYLFDKIWTPEWRRSGKLIKIIVFRLRSTKFRIFLIGRRHDLANYLEQCDKKHPTHNIMPSLTPRVFCFAFFSIAAFVLRNRSMSENFFIVLKSSNTVLYRQLT